MRRSRTCKRRVERNGSSFSRRQKSGLLLQRLNHVAGVVAYSSMQLLLQLRTPSIYSRTKLPLGAPKLLRSMMPTRLQPVSSTAPPLKPLWGL